MRVISVAPLGGTRLATRTTPVDGAFDLIHDSRRMTSRADASVSSVTTTAVCTSCIRCGCATSIDRGRSMTVLSNAARISSWSWVEGGAVGQQRLVDRSLGRQDRQLVVGLDHRAFDEQAVDAAGVLDRIGQAASGFEVERQRAGAEVHVEVEQRGRAAVLVAEQPGERGRQRRRARTAARADDRDHHVRAFTRRLDLLGSVEHRLCAGERIAQLVGAERLEQIVLDTAGDEVAVQPDIVDLARGDDDGAGFADFGKRVDVVQRIAAFGQVDEQDLRAGGNRQRLDGVAQAALHDLVGGPTKFDRDRTQRIGGHVVADEGGEGFAQRARARG